jgi:3-deoxy-D-manno-octulosonic-acid transferase
VNAPFGLTAYRGLSAALSPFAGPVLRWRARAGKEDQARLSERFGMASAPRPAGKLVWLHGASVGEARVLLLIQDALAKADPALSFLITTGTVTSAADVARAAPERTLHQYAPLDRPEAVRRFLAHWKPDLAVFAESEVWPNLLLATKSAGVPIALVNARLSPKSLSNWARLPETAALLLASYDVMFAVDRVTAQGLERLTQKPVIAIGNLKLAAPAPIADATTVETIRGQIGARATWLAASTHEGEDEILLAAHEIIRKERPDALLFLAPRHPVRGEALAALAGGAPRRSMHEGVGASPVYIVDTMGELGAFFALAPVTFVAGSLDAQLTGHNPIEPARAGSAVLSGPYVESFADIYGDLFAKGGALKTADASAIAAGVLSLWNDEPRRAQQIAAARDNLAGGEQALTRTRDALLGLLKTHAPA